MIEWARPASREYRNDTTTDPATHTRGHPVTRDRVTSNCASSSSGQLAGRSVKSPLLSVRRPHAHGQPGARRRQLGERHARAPQHVQRPLGQHLARQAHPQIRRLPHKHTPPMSCCELTGLPVNSRARRALTNLKHHVQDWRGQPAADFAFGSVGRIPAAAGDLTDREALEAVWVRVVDSRFQAVPAEGAPSLLSPRPSPAVTMFREGCGLRVTWPRGGADQPVVVRRQADGAPLALVSPTVVALWRPADVGDPAGASYLRALLHAVAPGCVVVDPLTQACLDSVSPPRVLRGVFRAPKKRGASVPVPETTLALAHLTRQFAAFIAAASSLPGPVMEAVLAAQRAHLALLAALVVNPQ